MGRVSRSLPHPSGLRGESSSSTCSRAPATENCMPPPGAEAVRPLLRRSDLFIEFLGAVFRRRRKKAPRLGARLTPEHDFRYGGPRKYGAHLQYTECMLLPAELLVCLPRSRSVSTSRRPAGAVPIRVWKKEVSQAEKSSFRRDGRLQSLIPVRFEALGG